MAFKRRKGQSWFLTLFEFSECPTVLAVTSLRIRRWFDLVAPDRRWNVCRKLVTMLAVFMLAGCAAGGQASSAGDLELVIQNERQERMTAYVQWYQRR